MLFLSFSLPLTLCLRWDLSVLPRLVSHSLAQAGKNDGRCSKDAVIATTTHQKHELWHTPSGDVPILQKRDTHKDFLQSTPRFWEEWRWLSHLRRVILCQPGSLPNLLLFIFISCYISSLFSSSLPSPRNSDAEPLKSMRRECITLTALLGHTVENIFLETGLRSLCITTSVTKPPAVMRPCILQVPSTLVF